MQGEGDTHVGKHAGPEITFTPYQHFRELVDLQNEIRTRLQDFPEEFDHDVPVKTLGEKALAMFGIKQKK